MTVGSLIHMYVCLYYVCVQVNTYIQFHYKTVCEISRLIKFSNKKTENV